MKINQIDVKLQQVTESYGGPEADRVRHIKSLPYLSLVQSVEGSYSIAIDDGEVFSTGTEGFFIAPARARQNIVHHTSPRGRMHMRWIFLEVLINDSYPIESIFEFPVILPDPEKEKIKPLFDELFATEDACDRMSLSYQIVKILLSVAREKDITPRKEFLEVLDFIRENYQKNIRISHFAELTKMSEANFYAVFRKYFNSSPIAYLNDYRLMLASELLKNTNERIGTIAEQVGIPDQLYFSKLFKKKYAVSPKTYRRNKEY